MKVDPGFGADHADSLGGAGFTDAMEERCASVDLSKNNATMCIRLPGSGNRARREVRTSTNSDGLRDWRVANRITWVRMEATPSYWKPLFYLLEAVEGAEPWLLNAQHIKYAPGRKTDVEDRERICRLVAYDLARPSSVPPRDVRQLRD
ncbi:IS110 family transposase [Streptomyces wuyuanensis]|uniref:IS110 family transposase n=1 Tax=Streptomyces wuyuanensis TaxID=1196353 RepID=UPI00341CE8F5